MVNVNKVILLALCVSLSAATVACGNNENNTNNTNNPVQDTTPDVVDEPDVTTDEGTDEEADETSGGTALVQVMHVSPDAPTVDVYVNGALLIDDLEYKTATKFFEAPAGVDLVIDIRAGDAAADSEAVYTEDLGSLAAGSKYIVAAAGSAAAGASNGLDLIVIPGALTAGTDAAQTSVLALHASPDAPAVDLLINNAAEAQLKAVPFGVFAADGAGLASYVPLEPNGGYIDGATTVGVFTDGAHVRSFNSGPLPPGAAITVVATGLAANFLDDDASNDDKSLGLTAFFSEEGGPDERATTADLAVAARVQIVHNSPEPAASLVDVFVGDQKLLDNFAFRTASPFITVPAAELNLKVSGEADDVTDALVPGLAQTVTLESDGTYIVAAMGALAASYTGGAEGVDGSPKLVVLPGEEPSLKPASSKRVKIVHGIPDIPVSVGVRANAGLLTLPLVDGVQYPTATDYIEIPAAAASATVSFEVFYDAGLGEQFLTTAPVDLSTLGDAPQVVYATGFFDEEQYGATTAPALMIVTASGDVVVVPLVAPAL